MGRKHRTFSERGFAGASMHNAGGKFRGKSYANTPYKKPQAPSKYGEPKRKWDFGGWGE